jgi:hypothetical protein
VKKVFDKRNLKLFERLLENQGVSLKKDNTLNEVSLSKRLSSFKQAVVGSTGEDAWKDAWDIASSGMSDPEAEKQLYQAAAEWWHSTGKLKKEEAPVSDKEKADRLMQQVASLGLTDLQSNTRDLLGKLAGMLADKPPEETEKAIDNIKKVAQDGELDATDVTAVAKEVPADVELAPDKYPPLKLAGEKGKIDTLGIIKWLKDYPGVEPGALKSLARAMDSYFDPAKGNWGNTKTNWKANAAWTAPNVFNFTNKLTSMNEEAVKADIEQALGGYKTSDAKRLQTYMGKNPALIRQLALINSRAEYEEVITAITDIVNDKIPNPSDIATGLKNVLSKYMKVAPKLKGDDEQLDAKTAPLTRGPSAVGNTKVKGSQSLKDTMKSRNIPGDAIKQVLQALAGEFKINNIPFKEGMLRENKKRKVVIRYGKSKAKKEES